MEYWDVYDINRIKTGRVVARHGNDRLKENEYHLGIHVCVFNSKAEMLIQKRQITKTADPGKWDFSARGSVLKNETSQEGAHRELLEELGIDYNFNSERAKFTINSEKLFDDYYFIKKDINSNEIKLQKEEVEFAKWASKDEIIELIEENKFAKCSKELINYIFEIFKKQ